MHRVPALETAQMQMVNGPESFTSDNNYILGETPEVRKMYVAAGFNSSGIARSVLIDQYSRSLCVASSWIRTRTIPFTVSFSFSLSLCACVCVCVCVCVYVSVCVCVCVSLSSASTFIHLIPAHPQCRRSGQGPGGVDSERQADDGPVDRGCEVCVCKWIVTKIQGNV
jgi:hypothetical protein